MPHVRRGWRKRESGYWWKLTQSTDTQPQKSRSGCVNICCEQKPTSSLHAEIFFFFAFSPNFFALILHAPAPRRHAWLQRHLRPSFPANALRIQRVCKSRRYQHTSDPLTSLLLLLLTHYVLSAGFRCTHGCCLKQQFLRSLATPKLELFFAECETSLQPEEKYNTNMANETKVLTCVWRKSFAILMSTLWGACKYPWILAGWKMTAFIFYPESRTHYGADILPPSILQDRCGRSWLSRATCVLLLASPMNVKLETSCAIFKWNRKRTLRIACAFIVKCSGGSAMFFFWSSWCAFTHHLHPLEEQRRRRIRRRSRLWWRHHTEGRPRRHAPHWLVKATSRRWGGGRTETGIHRWLWRYC